MVNNRYLELIYYINCNLDIDDLLILTDYSKNYIKKIIKKQKLFSI